jgi:hypothetical protein
MIGKDQGKMAVLRPLDDRVVVEQIQAEEKTAPLKKNRSEAL